MHSDAHDSPRSVLRASHVAFAMNVPSLLYFTSLLAALLLPATVVKDSPIELIYVLSLLVTPLATAVLCVWCLIRGLRNGDVPSWLWGGALFGIVTTVFMLNQVRA